MPTSNPTSMLRAKDKLIRELRIRITEQDRTITALQQAVMRLSGKPPQAEEQHRKM